MRFIDNEHEQKYQAVVTAMGCSDTDVYRLALAYLLTLDYTCRNHLHNLYNFEDRCIIPSGLNADWQTSTSRQTTRLAFNLFTGSVGWGLEGEDNPFDHAVGTMFASSYAIYYVEALKIRYPEYFKEIER